MKLFKSLYTGVLAFVLCAGYQSVFAQEQEASDESTLTPKFGIKGGFNFSNLYVDNVQDEHVKVGGNIGFYAKLPVTKGLSIQPELIYSNKGAKEDYSNFLQGSGTYRFNLHYVEVPVLLVINLTKNFSISGGGYAAFLAGATVKDVDSDGTINNATELSTDDFNRFDYGLVGGVSVDIDHVTLGARYNYGLHNIGKDDNLAGQLTENSKNSVASLFIGFAF